MLSEMKPEKTFKGKYDMIKIKFTLLSVKKKQAFSLNSISVASYNGNSLTGNRLTWESGLKHVLPFYSLFCVQKIF